MIKHSQGYQNNHPSLRALFLLICEYNLVTVVFVLA